MLVRYPVAALTNDGAIFDHQCSKGPAKAMTHILLGESEDRLDQVLVIIKRFHGGGSELLDASVGMVLCNA